MIRSTHRRLIVAAVAGTAVAGAGLLTGCSAGRQAATAGIVAPVPGANASLYDSHGLPLLAVRNATLDFPGVEGYPAGGNAPMSLWIANSSSSTVTLIGAAAAKDDTSGKASSSVDTVVLSGGAPIAASCGQSAPPPSPSAAAPPSTAASATPGPSGSRRSAAPRPSASSLPPSATPAASPSPSPPGSTSIDVAIPPNCLVVLSRAAGSGPYLQIAGLSQGVLAGDTVSVMLAFRFADGSTRTVGASGDFQVPIAPPASALPRASLSLSPEAG